MLENPVQGHPATTAGRTNLIYGECAVENQIKFKPSDNILQQLVTARRDEVVRWQKSQADRLKAMEMQGQEKISALRKTLSKDMLAVLDHLDKSHENARGLIAADAENTKSRLVASRPSEENETAMHPGLAGGHLAAPNSQG